MPGEMRFKVGVLAEKGPKRQNPASHPKWGPHGIYVGQLGLGGHGLWVG